MPPLVPSDSHDGRHDIYELANLSPYGVFGAHATGNDEREPEHQLLVRRLLNPLDSVGRLGARPG